VTPGPCLAEAENGSDRGDEGEELATRHQQQVPPDLALMFGESAFHVLSQSQLGLVHLGGDVIFGGELSEVLLGREPRRPWSRGRPWSSKP
jgi:hypothetical protein